MEKEWKKLWGFNVGSDNVFQDMIKTLQNNNVHLQIAKYYPYMDIYVHISEFDNAMKIADKVMDKYCG